MATSERGTPQGGRASPLLYRIGSNDQLTKLNAVNGIRTTSFADGTAIVMSGDTARELESKVRAAIGAVSDWARTAEIKLNPDKTEIISIGRTKISELKVGENEIKTKRCLKYLGVMIDNRLMWKD